MSDATANSTPATPSASSLFKQDDRVKRRNAAEKRFKAYGLTAIGVGVTMLIILVSSVLSQGLSSFRQTFVTLPITVTQAEFEAAEASMLKTGKYKKLIQRGLEQRLATAELGDVVSIKDAMGLLSGQAPADLRMAALANQTWPLRQEFRFLANGRVDGYFKGRVTMEIAERDSRISPEQLELSQQLADAGIMETRFNRGFLTRTDGSPTRPEAAGLGVAFLGSLYMMMVVLALALPIGVATSIYLEELAPKNRWTDLIEVNISNLAAVPSIVFGILGLAIFINFAGLPQSAPLVGGLVLTLMTLPTIIIATRASLKSVPPSIRDAALGLGASKMQTVFHHVLPLAAPGILTGTIIGLAQALGETAPLLLIGMVALVQNYPSAPPAGLEDPATALPVQVYIWTTRSDPAFVERASGAIIVLLAFLLIMNIAAILLRRRFERRW
ncbi:phosphate ABC transporter permease PstA [Thalassobacter stenotrophicus]|uniref:Phosphate transport system permease protein PstA n=2 Tax=Thalassobacter stenotrophicus TaxID=266809 RepID=A0A0P1EX02_9RHOB|nr:phosphate ABC transporter permease PstA [Thalassobacter stenotrophicus]CUH59409.1 Phosphate transport system permease protein PstA [Thalassobacter stenotrophicus]SHI84302.1 phosphate ABC transporter membrane protein 2, PhoT family [Thalassobacter stenotrophicus DSM 16310]